MANTDRHEDYQSWQRAVDQMTAQVWMQAGGGLAFDPINPELGIRHVTDGIEDADDETRHAMADMLSRMFDFVWAEGPCLLKASKRWYALTRYFSPQHLAHMNQTEVAIILNEPSGSTSAREMRVEKWLKEKGFFGTGLAFKKSAEARGSYARRAAGNLNRKGGKKTRKKISVLRNQTNNEHHE